VNAPHPSGWTSTESEKESTACCSTPMMSIGGACGACTQCVHVSHVSFSLVVARMIVLVGVQRANALACVGEHASEFTNCRLTEDKPLASMLASALVGAPAYWHGGWA
jgi:hypothetical protein